MLSVSAFTASSSSQEAGSVSESASTHVNSTVAATNYSIGCLVAGRGLLWALKLRAQPNGRSKLVDAKRFFAHRSLAADKARGLEVEDFGIMRKPRPESLR